MDFYRNRGLTCPSLKQIQVSEHYITRWNERSGKMYKEKDIIYKIARLIRQGGAKIGKMMNGDQCYYVMDEKKRKHIFVICQGLILLVTIYVSDFYQGLLSGPKVEYLIGF